MVRADRGTDEVKDFRSTFACAVSVRSDRPQIALDHDRLCPVARPISVSEISRRGRTVTPLPLVGDDPVGSVVAGVRRLTRLSEDGVRRRVW